jgi:cell division protein FtsL
MEKYRPWMFHIIAAFGVAVCISSFIVQYKINRFDREIRRLEKEIHDADVETKVLKTELSHLATVARIKILSGRFLPKFRNISQGDVRKIVDIPIDPAFE